jgi:hypothetical protein
MLPYGMKRIEYENDSKRAGDLYERGGRRTREKHYRIFRTYKKRSRREGRAEAAVGLLLTKIMVERG